MSLILDASKHGSNLEQANECLKLGPFNTILMYASEDQPGDQQIGFDLDSFKFENLIVWKNVLPGFITQFEKKRTFVTASMTVHENDNLYEWRWLDHVKFKYIRIDNCSFPSFFPRETSEMILSEHLLVLYLVEIKGIHPWEDIHYELAPNLRELYIHGFDLRFLSSQYPSERFMNLKWLNLRYNKIERFEEGFFDKMPLLQVVTLEYNRLKTLSQIPTFKRNPKKLSLDGRFSVSHSSD